MTVPTFTSNRAQLLNALTIASRAVAKRTTVQILTHLLVEADAETDEVTVTGSNLETWIRHTFKANVTVSGSCTLPGKMFIESISKLSGASVDFGPGETERSTLLKSDRAKIKIAGLDPQDWNDMPDVKDAWVFSLPAQEVKTGISQVIVAAGTNNNQLAMTGVNMFVNGGVLGLAATDTHRMHVREIATVAVDNLSIVLPPDPVRAVLSSLGKEETIECEISPSQARFTFKDGGLETQIMTRLIDQPYPVIHAYKKKQDDKITGSVLISRDDMAGSVARAAIFKTSDSSGFTFKLQGDTALFEIEKMAEGGNSEEIEIAVEGDCPELAKWSTEYIGQMISVISQSGIRLSYSKHPKAPTAIITVPDDPNFWGVTMGMGIAGD